MSLIDRVLLLNLAAIGNFSLLVGHIGIAAGGHDENCDWSIWDLGL